MFTRRHYEWLVRSFAEAQLTENQVQSLADALSRDNYRFDAAKFLAAFEAHARARIGEVIYSGYSAEEAAGVIGNLKFGSGGRR